MTVKSFNHDDDAYAFRAQQQKAWLLQAAQDIVAGNKPAHPEYIATVLIEAANRIDVQQPGANRKVDLGGLLMRYAWLRHHDEFDHLAAVRRLVKEYGKKNAAGEPALTRPAIVSMLTPEAQDEALRQFEGVPRRPTLKKKT